MSRKLGVTLISIFVVLVVGIVGVIYLNTYFNDLPNRISEHETIILGQNRFVPGSQAALRVVVRDSQDASPLADAHITALLKPADGGSAVEVYSGSTDDQGTANVVFNVPADAAREQILIIETETSLGSDYVERDITLERDYRILLTTDKPIYQPGQEIHIRALALSTFDLVPAANQELEIIIADGRGNKVFRETLTTSAYGAAATDFQLASEVNTGNYNISVIMGTTSSEKTVTVEHYVLPKFRVDLETDRSFYLPGEHVSGTISAEYFYGQPVSGGEITIEGYTFDFERIVTFTLAGDTAQDGSFTFEFDLPEYIAGSDFEGGMGRYYVQASVTDLAAHTEISNTSLTVAGSTLIIEAIPEGGQFRTGVENILYVLTSYPDGTPAETDLEINFTYQSESFEAQTGGYGLAEVLFTPESAYQEISITARDQAGNTSTQYFYFEGNYDEETVLLRPDKPVYRVGETMQLTILTSQSSGTAYLDIIREGQTVSTRSVRLDDGQAQIAVDLTPDMYGTLELHAYKILSWGGITRDTRLVVVDAANALSLSIEPGQETYLPGDTAGIDIQVRGNQGDVAQAAVGLAIVDESVFALAQQDPGFARLYFMLEQELLTPRYELHGFSVPDLVSGVPVSSQGFVDAIEDAATASLAAAAPQSYTYSLQANSHEDAIVRAFEKRNTYFYNMGRTLFGIALLVPLAVLGVSGFRVWWEKRLGSALVVSMGIIAFLALILVLWPHSWANTPMEKIEVFIDWLAWNEGFLFGLLCGLGILAAISLGVLITQAMRDKDKSLGLTLVLVPLFSILILLSAQALSQTNISPSDNAFLWTLIAFLTLPFAFWLRSVSFAWDKNFLASASAMIFGVFLLVGAFPVMGSSLSRSSRSGDFLTGVDGGEFVDENDFLGGMVIMEAAGGIPPMAAADTAESERSSAGAAEAPRLRQYFPETMLWLPDAVTDEDGNLHLDIPVADSITTWRMTALASTQDGRLGSSSVPLRVFQDFFIDLDLPVALTVGDEISVPVGVFNYLEESQSVRLVLEQADWFELLDEEEKNIQIEANDISVVYFRVRVTDFGMQPFEVTAWGSQMSDAILKTVRVYPDGREIHETQSDRLTPGEPVSHLLYVPAEAIPGTQALIVKIYPGVVSQVVEGLDSILRMPSGCFEQTSSTTYPNILVLDYLQTTGQASPEVEFTAEEYINLGYQRLTTFEVPGHPGGFSLFGDPPPDPMLTAYGLQEFNDMSRVHNVDPALIARTAEWLLSQQNSDGSWEGVSGFHETTLTSQVGKLPVTAYVVWGLSDAGYASDSRTQRGVEFLQEFASQADDEYTLGLVANALVSFDIASEENLGSATEGVLERLAGMATLEGNVAYWVNTTETVMGSYGEVANLETTALAALAFLRAESHADLANAALTYLVQGKDNFGTWQTTQATVLALKAMIESVRSGAEDVDATVTVTLNDGQTRTVEVNAENFDVVQLLTFDDINIGRDNVVDINVEGEGDLMYQIVGSYYLPWDALSLYPELGTGEELVNIDVAYDRTELSVDDTVNVTVTVSMNQAGSAESALIDLGLPPGFSVETADLSALVARYNDIPEDYEFPTIERYEMTGRQILIYVSNLNSDYELQFSYRLRAKFPLQAQTPASNIYDYYNPSTSGESQPQILVVTQAED